ncbi:ISLre2 family transposase [Streptococcus hyointestinalis]|uniref:ISLre2 family transposase n=1 Tax=Streptococcus hyointestinalis TaxID=1337 RepID=UPI0013DEA7F0|nr:ISLre2 family transposase [Streptococcus hyointestinalis]
MTGFDEKMFIMEMSALHEKEFLKRIYSYDEQIASTMRQHGYKRVDSSERTVLFTFGEITFSRNRWRNEKETRYPVDEWLGLKPYMRYSPELLLHLAKLASKLSYREVCRTVKETYRLDITKDAVLKAVKRVGSLFSDRDRYRLLVEEDPPKIQADKIYLEGDGVMVKTTSGGDERHYTDLAHFLIHTGTKKVGKGRYTLLNKHEIINTDYEKARDELLDYLYNHFEISDKTILISNSDNGTGYTKRTFHNIKKALGIKRHEHFWDAYHVNEQIKQFFKSYPKVLEEMVFKAIQTHQRSLLVTVFDTIESVIDTDEAYEVYVAFRQKLFRHFKETKPPKLRGLSSHGIGVMESQHRKMTYRMKHRGMYWSLRGACTMARLILLERLDQLEELFFGDWRKQYQYYQGNRLSAGHLINHYPHKAVIIKR